MKRIIAIVFSAILTLSFLCGCKDSTESSEFNSDFNSSEPLFESTLQSGGIENNESTDSKIYSNTSSIVNSGVVSSSENSSSVSTQKPIVQTVRSRGIDVSKWQGIVDWKKVKSAGIDFAIIRIGYRGENGQILKDDNADYNIQQADKAGVLVGVYFFSTAINTAEALEEAKWTASMIEGYPISYPVVYDCEGFEAADSRMYNLTAAQRTQNAVTFLNHIKSLGYDAMFYGAKTDLQAEWDMNTLENGYKIWVAHYTAVTYPEIKNPDYSGKYDMWQYTNKGAISGVKGNTDMIVSYFVNSKAKPKVNKTVQTAKKPIEKDSVYTAVSDKVTAKNEVNLRDGAGTNHNIVGTFKNGQTLSRVAIGTNGWSKLIYNGKTVYAITSYLTTDLTAKPQVSESVETDSIYSSVNEQVTAKSETNLRTAATTNGSKIVHTLKNGETVIRTGIGSNGWSRIIYNGQTVYAVSSYLTTDLSSKPVVSEETPTQNNEMQFTDTNEQVTAKSETNLRTKPTTKSDSQVVYTLKSGEYVTRTGTSTSGWSRITYNGQTVYAISSYLTN